MLAKSVHCVDQACSTKRDSHKASRSYFVPLDGVKNFLWTTLVCVIALESLKNLGKEHVCQILSAAVEFGARFVPETFFWLTDVFHHQSCKTPARK